MLNIPKDRDTLLYIHHNLDGAFKQDMGFLLDMLKSFDEYPRVYHSSDHILDLCKKIIADKHPRQTEKLLLYTAIYHDFIYDPKASNNEEESARIFLQDSEFHRLDDEEKNTIYDIIIGTKGHNTFPNSLARIFYRYDLSGFSGGETNVLRNEMNIRKEYSWVDWVDYKKGKLKFLNEYRQISVVQNNPDIAKGIDFLTEYIKNEEAPTNVAVYAGSFNPFHVGHKNIIEKAEKLFDKVIVAIGHNPEKEVFNEDSELPKFLKYRQVDKYSTSLPEYLKSKAYNLTIIRGLRDESDFQKELKQLRWLQAIDKGIKVVYIVSDSEYAHISSSDIRNAQGFPDLKELADKYTL